MSELTNTITFLDQRVRIVRKHRVRRMTLSIRADRPLQVTSNLGTSEGEILHFLNSNIKWIQKNLAKIEEFNKNFKIPTWEEASLFPVLGEMKYLTYSETKKPKLFFAVEDGFIICYLPKNTKKSDFPLVELEKALHKFYKTKATHYLELRMQHWIFSTGLKPAKLKFGRATTRWGSCNSKKQIVLNWKLICHAPSLIDYVIVHELCHLQFLNHSDLFWNLLAKFMPEYLTYEKILNQEVALSGFLNSLNSVS